MIYCKLVEGQLIFAPQKIFIENKIVHNPTDKQLESQGWKQLVTSIPPEVEEGYHAEAVYFDADDFILQNWIVVEE